MIHLPKNRTKAKVWPAPGRQVPAQPSDPKAEFIPMMPADGMEVNWDEFRHRQCRAGDIHLFDPETGEGEPYEHEHPHHEHNLEVAATWAGEHGERARKRLAALRAEREPKPAKSAELPQSPSAAEPAAARRRTPPNRRRSNDRPGTNPDLSLGNQRPGVYVAVDLQAPGGGRTTTSNSSYLRLRDFATIDQIAFWRRSLGQRLADVFTDVSAKRFGTPKTPNTITAAAVAAEMYLLALEWEELDLYDGAATFKSDFKAKFNAQKPGRIDASFPMSPVINVHELGVIGNLVSPST
jgi:hypothetical protein